MPTTTQVSKSTLTSFFLLAQKRGLCCVALMAFLRSHGIWAPTFAHLNSNQIAHAREALLAWKPEEDEDG